MVFEESFTFDERIMKLKGNLYLDGYWQTEMYFKSIRNELLDDFEIKSSPSGENSSMLDLICKSNSVSVHIRRGDYVNNAETFQKHGVSSMEYYNKAINYINKRVENTHFFIFSDDIEWVRQNFTIKHAIHFIGFNDASKNFEDLRLMKNCKHNIIANSSFSWWGAWLNENPNKIVIAPANWFNDISVNTNNLIPSDWVSI